MHKIPANWSRVSSVLPPVAVLPVKVATMTDEDLSQLLPAAKIIIY